MTRSEITRLVKAFVFEVNKVMLQVAPPTEEQRATLRTMGGSLAHTLEKHGSTTGPAHEAKKAMAARRYEVEPFRLHWRSTDLVEELIGWDALIDKTALSYASLRSMFSTGHGKFTRTLFDQSNEPDACTIYRVEYVPGVGRPKMEAPEVTAQKPKPARQRGGLRAAPVNRGRR